MFDNSSTDMAPAIEPKNRDNKLLNFNFINKEIIESIASPAPTLSITLFAKAGQ